MLAIRLPEDIELRLAALAKATGRTKSFYARKAILDALEDMEDIYLSEKVLEQVRSGDEKILSSDAFWQELDI